jgi:drug/metabolite transporter (DMT)-like permease
MPQPVSLSNHRRGVIFVLIAAALWSTSGLLVRIISADEPTIIFWRSVSASVFLGLYILHSHKGSLRSMLRGLGWPGLMVASLLSVDAVISVFALAHTHVANVMLIFSMTPFIAGVIAWCWLRESVLRATWVAMTLCVVGVVIMVSGSIGTSLLLGDGLAFIVVFIFATSVVAIRRYPTIELIVAVWVSSMLGVVMSWPFATPFGHGTQDYALMAIFGALEYALALLLFTIGARHIPAAQSTLIGLLEVVLSPIWVWLAINEVPQEPTLIGGTLILITLVIYALHDTRSGGKRQAVVG